MTEDMADTFGLSSKFVKPALMGVLNVTPDSYYDGGRYLDVEAAVARGICMAREGAAIIDIGGESTRPFSEAVSEREELRRVLPVIEALSESVECCLSIDTTKPAVAAAALEAGASMVNDISGLADPKMVQLVGETGVPVCLMHMQGMPQTMQIAPDYPGGVVADLLRWFERRVASVTAQGVARSQIILDPGIGFGKTPRQCCELIGAVSRFKELGFPVLIGASRKSFIGKILDNEVTERLSATLAAHTIALVGGADILRVHDVREHRDAVRLVSYITGGPLLFDGCHQDSHSRL